MKCVIIAGGIGARLWPLSRKYFPKQFISFHKKSLLQSTISRISSISKPEDIYIVSNFEHRYLIRNQLDDLEYQIPNENILLEPASKNTLPAITWVMKKLSEENSQEEVVVFPSDHLIEDRIVDIIQTASSLSKDAIVTFGVYPTSPHTGYGYIQPGEPVPPGFRVMEFKEKPDLENAQKYLELGYLWNSGIIMTTPDFFFKELKAYQPEIYESFFNFDNPYEFIDSISIDYGLLEKSRSVIVVPLDVAWSDLGNFESLYNEQEHDGNGNVGGTKLIDTDNSCFIHDNNKHVCAIGVRNLVVVDTEDALLVCDKNQTERVKELVQMFESVNDPITEYHSQVHRPWGRYLILEDFPFFKIKRVTVKPEKSLSMQMHYHRSEHWIVVSGTARIILDGKEQLLKRGESTFVQAGTVHRLSNPGKIPLEIIEVQIGEYLSEEDIVRFEDDYGRITV